MRRTHLLRQLLIGLSATGALLASPGSFAAADTPLPFGLTLATPRDAAVAVQPRAGDGLQSLTAIQADIQRLEQARGPYHPGLAAPLLAAAAQAERLELADTASQLYAWALHNTRVNQGLAAPEQVPIVEALLALHRRAGDSEAVNDREAYLYRLSGSGKPPWSEAKLAAAVRHIAWRQQWLMLGNWPDQAREALDLHRDGLALTEAVCGDADWAAAWCAELTLRVVGTLYLIDYWVEPVEIDPFNRRPRPFAMVDTTMVDERLLAAERSAYTTGVRLLEAALAVEPENAMLRLALADWRWFQDRRSAAIADYQALGENNLRRLRRPVPLPEQPLLDREPELVDEPERVRVALTVTRTGRVRDVQFPGAKSQSDGVRGRVRRALRELRFRPALATDGSPIEHRFEAEFLTFR